MPIASRDSCPGWRMTLSRNLSRRNDGPTNNKLVLCHCWVANWTKPRAWFCVLRPQSGPGRGFYTKFHYLSLWVIMSYHVIRSGVWTIGQHDKWTWLQKCFADSQEYIWTLFWLFGLIRTQNKGGIYHFRIVSPHSSNFTRCLIFPGPGSPSVASWHQCPMTLPSALNMSYSQNIQNIPTYLW